MSPARWLTIAVLVVSALGALAPAHAVTIDFDALSDGEVLTTQLVGLTFTNAIALTAGIGLNEFDFPPRSGSNVVFDSDGTMTIVFDVAQASVGGYFTYVTPITLTAFGTSGDVLGSITSAFSSNLATESGSSPNEFLRLALAGGITRLTIAGGADGGSFTLDDLTYEPRVAAVPEPSSLLLLGAAVAVLVGRARRRRAQG